MTKFDVSSPSAITDARRSSVKRVVTPRSFAPGAPVKRTAFDWPLLPWPRGPLSGSVISALQRSPGTLGPTPPISTGDVLTDDDFELALYLCYEVHYRGLADADWEWDSDLLRFRRELESAFVNQLRDEIGVTKLTYPFAVLPALDELTSVFARPSLSKYLRESGNLEQLREFCVHHSAYQLKKADPHTFAIPRLTGEAKAALVDIQYDIYGLGHASSMHSTLFASTMVALGLDSSNGSYVEILPGITLATVNLISMFALHRRWRAALVGHLTVNERDAGEPMGDYAEALTRCGVDPSAREFFDASAELDARHATIARERLVVGLLGEEPHLGADVLFGASAALTLGQRFNYHLLDAWKNDRSSLVPWEMKTP